MIEFQPMNELEYNKFLNEESTYYEDYSVAKKITLDQAEKEIDKQKSHLLPKGLHTDNHYFYNIFSKNKNEIVGRIWFFRVPDDQIQGKDEKELVGFYLADILIFPDFRRKNFGKQTLVLFEEEIIKYDAKIILLNVFRHNQNAFNLYSKVGYAIQSEDNLGYRMIKKL